MGVQATLIITVSGRTKPVPDIEGGEAGIGFRGLGGEAMVFPMSAKEGFEAKHGGFGQAASVITTLLFPHLVAVLLNSLQARCASMRGVFG